MSRFLFGRQLFGGEIDPKHKIVVIFFHSGNMADDRKARDVARARRAEFCVEAPPTAAL